jgi:hypothetical protein
MLENMTILSKENWAQNPIFHAQSFRQYGPTGPQMGIRQRHSRHPTPLLQILGDLGMGKRLTQRRSDVNGRKAIFDVRIFLKSYVMPLFDDPFREFEGGWGIKFTVNDQIGRRQVKTIEDDEIADKSDENSPFTYQDDIDPVEMAGFSIRQT